MSTITAAQRETALEQIAAHLADDWNYDRDPMLTAMFRDCAETAVCAVLAALGITVSDEPEAPDDVIERARATVERSMGRAWTDEGEYANLPQQAAHDLAAAGLLRTEPDDAAERVRHILSSGYGCVTCAVDDLRSAVGLPTADAEREHGPDDTAERIARAIEAEGFNLDRVSVGVFEKFSVYNDALDLAARIAREVGEAGR